MTCATQQVLFSLPARAQEMPRPVNVAAIPQRSPFRYPGGKTWFVPTFRDWIASRPRRPETLIEPFAGGGIISLTALFERLVPHVVMAEIDEAIAAVWQSVVHGKSEWIAKKILSFDLTEESVVKEISRSKLDEKGKAFQTILKNRTLHGGILAEGSGLPKYGENGKGISSRWYPATLARRFRNLAVIAEKMEFRQEDGLKVIQEYSEQDNVVFFIDPPYTAGKKKAGRRLYRHHSINHEHLFELCESINGDFVMTYDDAEEVRALVRRHGFQMRLIPMTNTHHAIMEELVIGKDLAWMDCYHAVHEPAVDYPAGSKAQGSRKRQDVF
ncbi:MAG: DNA adenine methylase [Nitrospira sp.]|nr:DNA adenine methylase [Nitrospira sp.]